jgi:flap endonuclease-1
VYEAPLLRNITNRNSSLVVISGAEVRASLGLDRPAFVDFALLLGTDFSRRIKNVGPARAFKFIREHGSIEAILAAEHKYPTPDTYLTEVASARGVFTNMPPLPPPAALVPRSPDERRIAAVLRKYGVEEREYDWERVYDDTTGTAIGNDYFGDRPASDSVPFNFEPFR